MAGAMSGFNAAPSRRGSRLLFVRENAGHQRIFDCTLDFSELDVSPTGGRAYCRSPRELSSLRGSDSDFASPCWSHDNQWIFFAMKGEDTTWDIYRDKYGASFQREGLVITSDADEREVTCGPLVLEAVPVTQTVDVMPYREPVEAYREPQTYELLQPCLTNAQCTNGKVCREGYCRAP
jgi:Cys-rich repeat protein